MSNILIVVEGKRTEPTFFKQISKVYNFKHEIYCFSTNIYTLYEKMKSLDFNGNLTDILIEMSTKDSDLKILNKKYAYTYLVYDFDAHHRKTNERDISIEKIITNNICKLKEMTDYFVDETDPTIGKLYINYPMMESYKDCDNFFEEEYAQKAISIMNIQRYKEIVSKRKISNKRIDTFNKYDFNLLSKMNVYKLKYLIDNEWTKINYDEYIDISSASNILKAEKIFVENSQMISVLNTSLFILLDFLW